MRTGERLFTDKNRRSVNNAQNAAKQHEADCGVKVIGER